MDWLLARQARIEQQLANGETPFKHWEPRTVRRDEQLL